MRVGGRTLGGALSWSTPQPLGPIEDTSLFAGLPVPQEVTVNRQVLADPAMLGRDVDVWARLQDGTPLVTARKLGQGQIILFHVTANSDWSNLPLSGLFVEMLRRISALGGGVADEGEASAGDASGTQAPETPSVLAPLQTLDGYGVLKSPPPTAQPVSAAQGARDRAEPRPSARLLRHRVRLRARSTCSPPIPSSRRFPHCRPACSS